MILKKSIPAPDWFVKEWYELEEIRQELENYLANEKDEKERMRRFLALDEKEKGDYTALKDYFDAKSKTLWTRLRWENKDKEEIRYGRLIFVPAEETIEIEKGSWKKGFEFVRNEWKAIKEALEKVEKTQKDENKDKKL